MSNYRKLSSQAEAEIEALRYQGVTLSDSDIIAINALCWEIENPSRRVSLARGKPVKCGNVYLWPLTIHNGTWLNDVGFSLEYNTEEDISASEVTMAYAMAHRDDDMYLIEVADIMKWFKSIRATVSEIRMAMSIIADNQKRDELPVRKGAGITVAQLAQLMVDNHGGTFDMWEKQCSIDYVFDFIDTTCKQDEAEQKHNRNQKMTMILGRFTNSLLKRHKSNG
jgi:hypothetical protein